jgi:aerobic carbon-monoxide dehydrogenase medium subunit
MYAPEFGYYRAASVADAQRLLAEHAGAKLLAGGHSLIPLLKLRLAAPPALIDIGRIAELRGIAVRGDRVRIGALATHAEIAASEDVKKTCPLLAEAAALIGDPQVRNRGTIGGNLAHADPASDLPAVLAAVDARLTVMAARGERAIDASDFFQGLMATALADDEILTAVEVPVIEPGQGSAYAKFRHPASGYAVLGVAALLSVREGKCTAASVALGGLVPRPTRAASVERALRGSALTEETIGEAARAALLDIADDVLGDVYASADYRRAMAPVYVKRALLAAARRAAA